MSQLKDGRPETAAQVLSQLVAPAREAGGAEAGDALAQAARAARAAVRADAMTAPRGAPRPAGSRRRSRAWSRGSTRSPAGSTGAGYGAERLPLARPDAGRRVPAAGPDRAGAATSEAGSRRWRSAIAVRAARAGMPTLYLSGEMSPERVLERALALEGRAPIDDLRQGRLDAHGAGRGRRRGGPAAGRAARCCVRCSARASTRSRRRSIRCPAGRWWWWTRCSSRPRPCPRPELDERMALAVRALKALAMEREPGRAGDWRSCREHRPGPARPAPHARRSRAALGAIKQNADVVLAIYREEMYRPGQGVEGATELIVAKNRNGPTGFVDLFFYPRWLRFEDMLDPRSASAGRSRRRLRSRAVDLATTAPPAPPSCRRRPRALNPDPERRAVLLGEQHGRAVRVRRIASPASSSARS